jgi:hypothetical protein
MVLFYTDSLSLTCADVQAVKQWWLATFDCKETKVPKDWDCPLPSDVALKLAGLDDPTILLSDRAECQRAAYDRENSHVMVFCANLKKAHEYLSRRNAVPSPIQDGGGGAQFFNVTDPEGTVIEVCKET